MRISLSLGCRSEARGFGLGVPLLHRPDFSGYCQVSGFELWQDVLAGGVSIPAEEAVDLMRFADLDKNWYLNPAEFLDFHATFMTEPFGLSLIGFCQLCNAALVF